MARNLRDRGFSSSMDNYNQQKKKKEEEKFHTRQKTTSQGTASVSKGKVASASPVGDLKLPKAEAPVSTQRMGTVNNRASSVSPTVLGVTGRQSSALSQSEFNRSTAMIKTYGNYDNYLKGKPVTNGGYSTWTEDDTNELLYRAKQANMYWDAYNDASEKYDKNVQSYRKQTEPTAAENILGLKSFRKEAARQDKGKELEQQGIGLANLWDAYQARLSEYNAVQKRYDDHISSIRTPDEVDADIAQQEKDIAKKENYLNKLRRSATLTKTIGDIGRNAGGMFGQYNVGAKELESAVNLQNEIDTLEADIENDRRKLQLTQEEKQQSEDLYWQKMVEGMPVSARRALSEEEKAERDKMRNFRYNGVDVALQGINSVLPVFSAIDEFTGGDTSIVKVNGIERANLNQITPEEWDKFEKIWENSSKADAYRYLEYLNRTSLNSRRRAQIERNMVKEIEDHPWYSDASWEALSVLLTPLKISSFAGQTADMLVNGEMQKDASYNDVAFLQRALRGEVANEADEWFKKQFGSEEVTDKVLSKLFGREMKLKPASFATNAAMSVLDNLYLLAITGQFDVDKGLLSAFNQGTVNLATTAAREAAVSAENANLLIMGFAAAPDTVIEAMDRGLSSSQAYVLGSAAGMFEILTEKVSLDALLEGLGKKSAGMYLLTTGFAEETEEIHSGLLNWLLDVWVSQGQSEWRQSINKYKRDGMSSEDAVKAAFEDKMFELAQEGAAGFLSGIGMAGGMIASSTGKNAVNSAVNNYNAYRKAITSTENVNRLVQEGLATKENTPAYKAAENLKAQMEMGDKITIREVKNTATVIDTQKRTDKGYVSEKIEEAENYKRTQAYSVAANLKNKLENNEDISIKEVNILERKTAEAKFTSPENLKPVIESAKASDPDTAAYKDAVKIEQKINAGQTVTVREALRLKSEAQEAVASDLLSGNPETIGRHLITEDGKPILESAANTLKRANREAINARGERVLQMIKDGTIDAKTAGETFLEAEQLKKNTAEQMNKKPVELKPREVTEDMDDFDRSAAEIGVSVETAAMVKQYLQAFGINGRFEALGNDALSGYYDKKTGGMVLNANSDDAYLSIVAHEVTHDLEKAAGYQKFADLVFSRSKNLDADLDRIVRKYADAGIELDADGNTNRTDAKSELVAEFVEEHLFNDEKFIKDVVSQDRSLAQRVLNWINDALAKLGNKNAQERQMLRQARDLWADALQQRKRSKSIQEEYYKKKGQNGAQTTGEEGVQNAVNRDVINSEEFKEWFGDWKHDRMNASKVVDALGRPLVLYHNTSADFWTFDLAGHGDNMMLGPGIYLTPYAKYASKFGGRQMALYADVRKPATDFRRTLKKADVADLVEKFVETKAQDYDGDIESAKHRVWDATFARYSAAEYGDYQTVAEVILLLAPNNDIGVVNEFLSAAKSYSNVKSAVWAMNNVVTPVTGFDGFFNAKYSGGVWRVINSEQLKSATDNVGTFDRSNPDVRFSVAPATIEKNNAADLDSEIDRVFEAATPVQNELNTVLRELSNKLGTKYEDVTQKSKQSMKDKVTRKHEEGRTNYTVMSMKDHARSKVDVKQWEDIPKVLDFLGSKGIPYVTEAIGPTPYGYKGFHVTWQNADGISSELQVTMPHAWAVKLQSDKIYDKWRNVKLNDMSAEQRAEFESDLARSNKMWADLHLPDFSVWDVSSSDNTVPLRNSSPDSGEVKGLQLPSTNSRNSLLENSTTRPDSVRTTNALTSTDSISQSVGESKQNGPKSLTVPKVDDGIQYGVKTAALTAGIDIQRDSSGRITFKVGGKNVTEVTTDHIENHSAFGAMIKLARDGVVEVKNGKRTVIQPSHISAEEADAQFEAVKDLMNLIMSTQNPDQVWEFAGSQLFAAVKSNSDGQYSTTVDFTTVCRKTQDMITAMSEAMMEKKGGLTKREVVKLQKKLVAKGLQVNCPVCYVFSRWAGVGTVLDNMWTFQNRYDKMSEAEIRDRLEELKARDRSAERARIRSGLKDESSEMYDNAYTGLVSAKEGLQSVNTRLRSDLRQARKNGIQAQIKQLESAIESNKETIEKLNKQIKEIEDAADTTAKEIVWLEKVRLAKDYKFVPSDILFNMADSKAVETFVKEFSVSWKYRTSRGPALGKAIVPYADMRLGDFFKTLGTNSAATFLKSNGKKGNTFSNPKEVNGYSRAVVGTKGAFNKSQMKDIIKAVARVRAQNLIGGQRLQSTSDFRYDYALDYIQAFFEAQAVGSNVQTYTKILEFGEMVAKFGGDVNLSVMPKDAGFVRNTGASKLTYRDGNYTGGYLLYSNTTGVNYGGAKILSDRYDSAQLILVGINDDHIRLALNDDVHTGGNSIGFVIPYHASGASIETFIQELVKNLGEEFKRENYTDYSTVQTDSKKAGATQRQVDNRNLRRSLLTETAEIWEEVKDENGQIVYDENGDKKLKKKTIPWAPSSDDIAYMEKLAKNKSDISNRPFAELLEVERLALKGDSGAIRDYESWSADLLWNLYNKMWTEKGSENGVRLTSKQAEAVMPHEYWDKTSTRDTAYLNGFIFRSYCFNLGLNPRFTGINTKGDVVDFGDFSDCRGYWKTLIDRAMYANDGTYRDQQQINLSKLEVGMVDEKAGKAQWGDKMVPKPQPDVAKEVGREFGKLSLPKVEQKTAPEGGRQYAIKKGDTTVIVSPDYDYSKSFAEQVKDYKAKLIPKGDNLVVGGTPTVLQKIGFARLPIVIGQGHLGEWLGIVVRDHGENSDPLDHRFTDNVVKHLPDYIADPVAVIASATHPDTSVVVLVEVPSLNGKPSIAPILIEGTGTLNGTRYNAHVIKSFHGRTNWTQLFKDALNDRQKLFYVNKNKVAALRRSGLQLPSSVPTGPYIHSIHDPGVSVKDKSNISNQTQTQQFERWSAGSKVGAKTVPASQIYLGFNAESIDGSENYTDKSYLRITNPLQFKNQVEATRWYNENVPGYKALQDKMYEETGTLDELLQEIDDQMDAEGITEEEYAALEKQHEEIEDDMDAVEEEYRGKMRDKLNDYFSKSNYDGVIVENTGSKTVKGKQQAVASYTVFDKTQIKSAENNIGTFFPKNEKYRFAVSKAVDTAYLKAVESGDMETAQQMVDDVSSNYIQQFLLPNDNDEAGFKYHRGPAPTKTFKRYAVMNVTPEGFKAAYAGNKTATPIGVWLDAQNLQSYMSDVTQFRDGSFATYITGDTGGPAHLKFSPELLSKYGLKRSQHMLLERGGKHSSDVPNFSQMNLYQDENGNKVKNNLRDGALPHNKLVFEIEYGISDDGNLTDYVRENGRISKSGKNEGIAKIKPLQFYDFKTNPNAVGNWGIGGTFRINRLVPLSEIESATTQYRENAIAEATELYKAGEISKADYNKRVQNANAIQTQKWVDGYHPEDFGLSEQSVEDMAKQGNKMKLTDAVTYDDAGNVIPLSERFNPEKEDLRYAVKKSITEVRKEERAKFAETKERERERRHLRELQQKTMKKLKWAKQNQFRAPKDMAADWADLVADMDTYAINVARSFTKDGKPIISKKFGQTYADVAQMAQDLMEEDKTFHPSAELQRVLDRVTSGHLGDFDYDGLQDYYNALTALQSEFQNRNKAILGEELAEFSDIFKDAKRGMQAVKDKKNRWYFNKTLLTPTNYLKMLAGWDQNNRWMDMVKDLEDGERKMRDFTVRANRLLDDFKKENKNWLARADGQGRNGIWIEAEVPVFNWKAGDLVTSGETRKIYMTPLQRVQLYLESKGYQNMTHIANGRCFADKELYTNKKTKSEAFNNDEYRMALDPETVQDLVKDMSPQEKELAKILEYFYNEFSPQYINETSQRLWGYDKSIAGYYAPINVNKNYAHHEIGVGDTTAKSVPNMKVRQVKANNPSNNLSALDAFDRSVRQTATFYGMATAERNWTTLLNWQTGDSSMRSVLDTNWRGAKAPAYIEDLIKELQGNSKQEEANEIARFIERLIGKSVSSTFGFNPGITMKQFGSFPTFGAMLGWTTMPVAKSMKVQSKAYEDLINTYTSELAYRTMGYASPETAQLVNNPGILEKNKTMNFLFSGGMIIAMDSFTVRTGWAWAENYVTKNFPDLEKGTEAQIKAGESPYYQKVAEVFEDAVSTTQPMYDVMHRANLMRYKGPAAEAVKAVSMFRTVPLQLYNTARRSFGELDYAKRAYNENKTAENKEAVSAAAGKAASATAAIIMSNLAVELVEFMSQWWKNRGKKYRDDDEELTAASVGMRVGLSVLADTIGVAPIYKEVADVIKAKLLGDKWYGIQIPAGQYLDDMVSSAKYAFQDIEDFVSKSADIMANGEDYDLFLKRRGGDYAGALKDAIEALGRFGFGLPLENLEKYILGAVQFNPDLYQAVQDAFKTPSKPGLTGKQGQALERGVKDYFDVRSVTLSDEAAKAISSLYEGGRVKAVPTAGPSKLSIMGSEIEFSESQKQEWERKWAEIADVNALVSSPEFQNADDVTKEKMLNKLYDYARIETNKDITDNFWDQSDKYQWPDEVTKYVESGHTLPEAIYGQVTGTLKSLISGKYEDAQSAVEAKEDAAAAKAEKEAIEDKYEGQTFTFKGEEMSYDQLNGRQKKIVRAKDTVKEDPNADLSSIIGANNATRQLRYYQAARDAGISNETYLIAWEAIDNADNGDGDYKQKKEVNVALGELVEQGNLTEKEAGKIWKCFFPESDSNPFPVGAIGLRLPFIG